MSLGELAVVSKEDSRDLGVPLWHNGFGCISGALGCRFDSPAQRSGSGVVAVAVAQVATVSQI